MPATWNNSQIINQLNSGLLWTPANLTYGFPTTASWFPYAEKNGFSPLTGTQQAAATQAIERWDELIAKEITLSGSPNTANIKLSNTTSDIGYAHAYFPGGSAAAGSVWFNPSYSALTSPTAGSYGYMTFLHEIGHALGLDHPGNYNGGSPTYASDALYAQDTHQYTVMSYFDADNTGADWRASNNVWYDAQTPMLHDVMAIQAMYGADMTTRSGDTVYGFNSTAGQTVFDFSSNSHPVLTIWDGGGVDTLDLSGFYTGSALNLAPGTFSNCDAMTGNLAIAHGAWIENATCGAGNDTITGNDLANILIGGGGNDNLNGGNGNDTLKGGQGSDILAGGAGDDFLYYDAADNLSLLTGGSGFDTLVFADHFVAFDLAGHALEQSMVTMIDLGSESWDESNDFYDVSGYRVRQDLFNDDGTKVVTDWDVHNQESWNHRVRTYNAQGVLTSEVLHGEDVPDGGGSGGGGSPNPTGTAGSDTLLGDDGDNVFAGLGGNDTLSGFGGADLLDGGTGADALIGGDGNDTYVVDASGDIVTEAFDAGLDAVHASITHTLTANVENLVLTGSAKINGAGNDLDNAIAGNAASNTLTGGAGNDLLDGGLGSDSLNGGAGNDTFVVESSKDKVTESSNGGIDHVLSSSVKFTLGSNVENLTLTGTVAISGTGNSLNNVIAGNNAANTLKGEAGNDILNGEGGRDILTGGKGADQFLFDSVGDMATGSVRDVISDFSRSQGDRISLAAIDADGDAANGLQSFAWVASFSGAAGQLRFNSAARVVAGDINGDGVADFEIGVNASSLAASDFIL